MTIEEWQPIPGFDGYEVSNLGQVRSWRVKGRSDARRKEPLILAGGPAGKANEDGKTYRIVILMKDGKRVGKRIHQLVLLSFVGPLPEGMVTRHLNGNPEDNRLENLVYGTPSENALDIKRHGRLPDHIAATGEDRSNSILTNEKVIQYKARYLAGESEVTLANEAGVTPFVMRNIMLAKAWKSVGPDMTGKYRPRHTKLSPHERQELVESLKRGASASAMAEKYGKTLRHVEKIFKQDVGVSLRQYRV